MIKRIKKLFLLDIGNTHARYGLLENGKMAYSKNCETALLKELVIPTIPDDVSIAAATVVPKVKKWFSERDVFWVSAAAKTGVDLSLVDALELGADRIANLAALADTSDLPAMIIDCGTAVTIEAIDSNKVFRGGLIAPGRFLSRKTLADHTAQLPFLLLDNKRAETFGWDTADSIRLGTNLGVIGSVKEFIKRTMEELGVDQCKIFVTGGDADILIENISDLEPVSIDFTLFGIALIWKLNQVLGVE